jgi:hypothetical protein
MSARLRSRLAVLAVALAGMASLATSQAAYPGLMESADDTITFSEGERTEVRQVVIRLVAGSAAADVSAEVGSVLVPPSEYLHWDEISVTVRAGEGVSIVEDAGAGDIDRYYFDVPDCAAGSTCTSAFSVTFAREGEDVSDAVELAWFVSASAGYPESPKVPDDAALSVEITR